MQTVLEQAKLLCAEWAADQDTPMSKRLQAETAGQEKAETMKADTLQSQCAILDRAFK